MAARTWWMRSGGSENASITDPGAEAYASPATGWVVSTGAGVDYSEFAASTERAASTFGATVRPDGSLDTTLKDYLFLSDDNSANPMTGTFDAGNWEFHAVVMAQTNGGAQDGAVGFRLFKGPNNASVTEITAGVQTGSTFTDLSTSASQDSTITVALGSITLTNEYLFVQMGCKRSGAGGMTSADVNFRVGTSGTRIISPNFTAGGGASAIAGADGMVFGQAAALTGTGALAGAAAEVFGQAAALTGTGALAGAAAEVFGQNATLTTLPSAIAGVAAEVFGQAASLTGTGALAGVAAETFGQNPALTGTGALAGVAAEAFGQNAALSAAGSGAMTATATITFSEAAALTGAGALAGVASAVFGESVTLTPPATATAAPTVTPAGNPARKRRWVIGNKVFYGTADEAAALAAERHLPEPVRAPRGDVVAKPHPNKVQIAAEVKPIVLPPMPQVAGLDYGLLNVLNASLAFDRAVNEQIKILTRKMQDEDDEDVWLLIS